MEELVSDGVGARPPSRDDHLGGQVSPDTLGGLGNRVRQAVERWKRFRCGGVDVGRGLY